MKKIYLILLFSLLLKLINLTYPIGGWHSWRQADTASIARNFHEESGNIFYPRIDWRGDTEGFVESELHIYPYIVSVFYNFFGVNEWIGRLLSIIISLIGLYFFYLLVKKVINESTALWASFIYAIIPLNIFYSRAFMPESMMLTCCIAGMYFYFKWFEEDSVKDLIICGVLISLASLIKIPSLYLGLPMLVFAYKKFGVKFLFQAKIWLLVLIIIIPSILWYYHAHQLFIQTGLTFSIWSFGEDKWGMFGLLITPAFYNDIFLKSIAERHLTYAGFILMVWGIFLKRQNKNEYLFDWWLIAFVIYILIAQQAHLAQEYYQLGFSIPASVYIGKVLSKVFCDFKMNYFKPRVILASILLVVLMLLSGLRIADLYGKEERDIPLFKISEEVKSRTNIDDLIISISDGNPVYLYNAHRKGWIVKPNDFDNEELLLLWRNDGAKYIIGEWSWVRGKENFIEYLVDTKFMIPISVNKDFFVYEIR